MRATLAPLRFTIWPAQGDYPPDERWRCRSNAHAVAVDWPWPAFAFWLATPVVGIVSKHEQGFSPLSAILPGKGGRRNGGPASFLVGEYDDLATPALLVTVVRELEAFDAVIYSTASATNLQPRFRFVIRPNRPIETDAEYRSCIRGCAKRFGVMPQDSQRTRLWYRPIVGCETRVLAGGQAWDVDASVQLYPVVVEERAPPSAATLAQIDADTRVVMARDELRRRQPEGMYTAACICHDCAVPIEWAVALIERYAAYRGWQWNPGEVEDRCEHAYAYAAQPEGWRLEVEAMRRLAK